MVGLSLVLVEVGFLGVCLQADIASVRFLLGVGSQVVVKSKQVETYTGADLVRSMVGVLAKNHSMILILVIVLLQVEECKVGAFRCGILVAEEVGVEVLAVNDQSSLIPLDAVSIKEVMGEIIACSLVHDAAHECEEPFRSLEGVVKIFN